MAFEAPPLPHLSVRASIDAWKSRWLQSDTKCPTTGWCARAAATYDISQKQSVSLRLRHTSKEATPKDDDGTEDGWHKVDTRSTSCKAIFTFRPTRAADLSSIAERTSVLTAKGGHETGLLIAQTVRLKSHNGNVAMALSGSLFNTDSYAARTYTRRPMVLYDMAFAACYGKGATATAMVTAQITNGVKIWAWCTHTLYTDRDKVGTGYEETNGPRRTDVKIQLQWKLWWKKQAQLWPSQRL